MAVEIGVTFIFVWVSWVLLEYLFLRKFKNTWNENCEQSCTLAHPREVINREG